MLPALALAPVLTTAGSALTAELVAGVALVVGALAAKNAMESKGTTHFLPQVSSSASQMSSQAPSATQPCPLAMQSAGSAAGAHTAPEGSGRAKAEQAKPKPASPSSSKGIQEQIDDLNQKIDENDKKIGEIVGRLPKGYNPDRAAEYGDHGGLSPSEEAEWAKARPEIDKLENEKEVLQTQKEQAEKAKYEEWLKNRDSERDQSEESDRREKAKELDDIEKEIGGRGKISAAKPEAKPAKQIEKAREGHFDKDSRHGGLGNTGFTPPKSPLD